MKAHRLIGVLVVLFALVTVVWANPLASRKISKARFPGWVVLQDLCNDTTIDQIWRQRLDGLPRGVEGYSMVSYRVARANSVDAARRTVNDLLATKRFSDYTSKGFKVTSEPWVVNNFTGVKFSVRGLDHTSDRALASQAHLYTFAVNLDEWFIWLEVRQSVKATELAQTDRALNQAGSQKMAEDLVDVVYNLWNSDNAYDNQRPPEITPPAPQPEVVTPPAPQPEVVTPPAPQPEVVTPPAPQPEVVTPPAPQPEVVTPPVPQPEVVTPPAGMKTWQTPDGGLVMAVPTEWTVSGKNVYTFKTPAGTSFRILVPETYQSPQELRAALQEFVDTQREISRKDFSEKPFNVDGALGRQVRYTAYHGHTMYLYFFGKSERLWRLEVDLDGDNMPMPEVFEQILNSLKVQ